MTATIKRTLLFITISATRAFTLFLAVSQTGASFGMLPGITLLS